MRLSTVVTLVTLVSATAFWGVVSSLKRPENNLAHSAFQNISSATQQWYPYEVQTATHKLIRTGRASRDRNDKKDNNTWVYTASQSFFLDGQKREMTLTLRDRQPYLSERDVFGAGWNLPSALEDDSLEVLITGGFPPVRTRFVDRGLNGLDEGDLVEKTSVATYGHGNMITMPGTNTSNLEYLEALTSFTTP